MVLEKYSMGIGDRFGMQGVAQLKALDAARRNGIEVVPVWNKSHREHVITGTKPESVRKEADHATKTIGWTSSYYVDADHISIETVDPFIPVSNFFTIDVAEYIGKKSRSEMVDAFVEKHADLIGTINIPGLAEPLETNVDQVKGIAENFLLSVHEAGKVYNRILEKKPGNDAFVTEISMDETDVSQSPTELLFILSAISDENIPIQTIAPKFSGRFNKGVDYVGDVKKFEREFHDFYHIINYAVNEFNLPDNLKISVHSGSDKFSIFEPIREALKTTGAGLHIKTAGTTWLEELIGLAVSGISGLHLAKEIYAQSLARFDELVSPYAAVIDIDRLRLPSVDVVKEWTGEQFASAIRHIPSNPFYNPNMRQLLHVGYRIAAEMGDLYYEELRKNADVIAGNVTENILDRHLLRVFG